MEASQEVQQTETPVSVTIPSTAPAPKKEVKPSTSILTRDRAYAIFSLKLPPSVQPATNDEEVINQMTAAIKKSGPNCAAVKATDLSRLSRVDERSLRGVLDRIVEGGGSRLFRAIPGIDYTDKTDAEQKIRKSIEADTPTFEECLRAAGIDVGKYNAIKTEAAAVAAERAAEAMDGTNPDKAAASDKAQKLRKAADEAIVLAGFSKPLTLNADEKIRQQQLEEFEKNYTAMRDAKIALDVQLYLTGAVRGIAIAEDADAAEKAAAAADEKAYIERIKKMDTDADLTTLLEMGLADDAFIKQLATFDPKTAGYTNVMDMLAYKAKDLGDGLYVKLDSKGEQFFIITNDNAENTKKVIEAQKNREVIEWNNVAPANTERHAEIQKLCLAAGKRVIINGQETPLSKAMPHEDPENYTKWIQNIRKIKIQNPREYDLCLKQLGDVLDEKGPDAKRQFWVHLSQYGSVEDRAAAEVVLKDKPVSIFRSAAESIKKVFTKDISVQGVAVQQLKDLRAKLLAGQKELAALKAQKPQATQENIAAVKARVKQLWVRFNNEYEDFTKLVENNPKEAKKLGEDLGKGILGDVGTIYLRRLDNIAEKLKTAEVAEPPVGTVEEEKKKIVLALEKVKTLSTEVPPALPSPTQLQLKEYLKKREELKVAVERGDTPQKIAKLKEEVTDLANKIPDGPKKMAADALEAADRAVQTAEERVRLEAEYAVAQKGYLALGGTDPEILDKSFAAKLPADDAPMSKKSIAALTEDFSEDQRKSLSDHYVELLNSVPRLEAEVKTTKETLDKNLRAVERIGPKSPELMDYLEKRNELTEKRKELEELKNKLKKMQNLLKIANREESPTPSIIDGLKEQISSLKDKIKVVARKIDRLKDGVTAAAEKVLPKDGGGRNAVDAVERVDTTLQQQREELEKAQGLLAATERRYGVFVASTVKSAPGIIQGVATEIINPTTRLEVIAGLPAVYKMMVEKEQAYKAMKEPKEQRKPEQQHVDAPRPF